MVKVESRRIMRIAWYAAILGIAYLIIGAIEFAAGLYNLFLPGAIEGIFGVPADLFGGFSSLVIGAAYSGVLLRRGKQESIGFQLIAILLSIVFGVLYLLIVCADGFGTLVSTFEGEEWTWEWLISGSAGTGILRPEIWLAVASLPLAYIVFIVERKKN